MDTIMIEGEYYLQGQREMASGFYFDTDNSFKFFFSYGALDRHGSGTWHWDGDRLMLNSTSKPAADFMLVQSKKTGEDITIRLDKSNAMLSRHVYCSLDNGADGTWTAMNEEGLVRFPAREFDRICLLLEFCPERFTTIPVNKEHTDFTFQMQPSVMEVFFENFTLNAKASGLSGSHPLLEGNAFEYEKQ